MERRIYIVSAYIRAILLNMLISSLRCALTPLVVFDCIACLLTRARARLRSDVTTQNAEITIEAWGRTGSRSGKLLGYATLPISEFRGTVQLHSDRTHAGKIQVRVDAIDDVPRPKVDDFELISVIGKGDIFIPSARACVRVCAC
jgi:hypothetical protein